MDSITFLGYKILGGLATPPGCFFAWMAAILLWGLLRVKDRMAQRINALLLFLLTAMYVLFMPLTANFLMAVLEAPRPDLPGDDVPTMVVVLAGGGTHPVLGRPEEIELSEQSYQRLAEGVRVAVRQGWPLVYSGAYDEGDAKLYERSLRKLAFNLGMKEELIVEATSRNTWENLKETGTIAGARGIKRIVLSTTAYHMKRALWMAQKQMPGLEIVPWPSGWKSTQGAIALNSFAASPRAFWDSCSALRELVGLAVYKVFKAERPASPTSPSSP